MKKILDKIGTVVMVLVVSVLVWLYAEDANVKQYNNIPVSMEFQPPVDRPFLIAPTGERVRITFSASNGQYQQLLERIRDKVLKYPLQFDPNDPTPAVEIDLRQLIEDQLLQDLGINLDQVEPATVTVTGEAIETVTLGVILDTDGVQLARADDPRPDQVTFEVPHSVAERLRGQSVVAKLTEADIALLRPGQDASLTLQLLPLKDAEGAIPDVTYVSVVLRQADNLARVTIDRRAVLLSYPPSLNQRFSLEIDEQSRFATNIELEGPREQIEAIRQTPTTELVWATVRLTNEEVETAIDNGGTIVKTVDIVTPPGVRQASEPIRVTIRVQRRPENNATGL